MRVMRRVGGLALATASVALAVAAGVPTATAAPAAAAVFQPFAEPSADAPAQEQHRQERHGAGGELADTGSSRALLFSGTATALCGLGVLVIVAARKRRD
ncbi:hypothetical protein [Streptomyces sp. Je 1-369]|uniref:hypothetical protein n=1 Tax=Streptomyces sp. Je 1-369 TaxID=2966192 RepID=UPI0022856E5D|nr:hypothetical protein [Streptomyces sp. Je 1-369]WAL96257.1 hypothetical protein NOO62_18250 [Streptomyces sp. Je 1-369]